jgi:hypothetical protein
MQWSSNVPDNHKLSDLDCPSISHVATVAHARWIEILTKAIGPLAKARVRYFDISEIEDAREWLRTAE